MTVTTSLREQGVAATARRGGRRCRSRLLRARDYGREIRFDRRHGVQTRGVRQYRGDIDGVHGYMPIRPRTFRRALAAAGAPAGELTFVDLGCGKGAALVLASEYGFRRVVGVEFDGELAGVAARNLRESPTVRRSGARAEVVHADATRYGLPDEPLLVYLYNPFAGPTLQGVVDNVAASLRAAPRDLWVVYVYPLERHRFDAAAGLAVAASREDGPADRPGDRFVIYRSTATARSSRGAPAAA
jgi:SAM-dependent methyltransferase